MSLRTALLEETAPQEEIVPIKTRSGIRNVLVVEMSVADRTAFDLAKTPKSDEEKQAGPDLSDIRERLIIACARDPETRERIFTDADLPFLATKGATAYEPVVEKAQEFNGLKGGEAAADVKN